MAQGRCSRRKEECRYNHISPADCGVGNRKTTWEDVRRRGKEAEPMRKRRRMDDDMGFFGGMGGGMMNVGMMGGNMMGRFGNGNMMAGGGMGQQTLSSDPGVLQVSEERL